jgi:hypothetical protein
MNDVQNPTSPITNGASQPSIELVGGPFAVIESDPGRVFQYLLGTHDSKMKPKAYSPPSPAVSASAV